MEHSKHINFIKPNNNFTMLNLNTDIKICGYFEKAYNHNVYRKSLNENIILYCVDGCGIVKINSQEYSLNKGDVVFLPSNTPHVYCSDNIDPWSIYWAHFTDISKNFATLFKPIIQNGVINMGYKSDIVQMFNNINSILANNFDEFGFVYANSIFNLILCQINSYHKKAYLEDNSLVEECKLYLENNINKSLSLDEISSYCKVSKYHLSHEFKKYTGDTIFDYFIKHKIIKACELLKNTDIPIKQISFELNYNSPYYFSSQFKSITGYSPHAYRKASKLIY